MTVDRRLVNWGIFLILLGGIPLAVSQGWLSASSVANAWQLWPLVLVGAGLGLILARTRVAFVGGLVVALTAGLVGGGLIAAPPSIALLGCGGGPAAGSPAVVDQGGTLVDGATVTMRATCASVTAAAADGAAWHVTVSGPADAAPSVAAGSGGLSVSSPDRAFGPFGPGRTNWTVTLPRSPRLSLDLTVDAGDATFDLGGSSFDRVSFHSNAIGHSRLDLSGATATSLDVEVNAGDLVVLLPTSGDLTGGIDANAASIRICAAPGTGLRLRGDGSITASLDFGGTGLVRAGDTWESPGFAGAAHRIDLATTGNAVSYRLTSLEGCR